VFAHSPPDCPNDNKKTKGLNWEYQEASANAGGPSRQPSDALGPAWLRFSLSCMSTLKGIILVLGISALYCGLAFMGYAFIGAGHGSEFFGQAILAPFSISGTLVLFGLTLWVLVGVLLALRRFHRYRTAAAAILALHYLGVLAVSFQTDWYYVGKVWQSLPVMVLVFLIGYLASQVFLWLLITRRQHGA